MLWMILLTRCRYLQNQISTFLKHPAFPLDWSLATLSVIGDIDEVHHLGGECHPFIMKVYSNVNSRSQTLT